MTITETLEVVCCVRGYHVYWRVWCAVEGETLQCTREQGNSKDCYAVAVKKDGVIVGHIPIKTSRVTFLFLRRGGSLQSTVTGRRQYSSDLLQGGLEIPCKLLFSGRSKDIRKLKKLV